MTRGFGIDFGTTNSLIAYFNPDIAQEPLGAFMSAEERGSKPHPSIVWYQPDGADPVVGWRARRQMNQMQNQTGHRFVHSIKRLMNEEKEVSILGTERKPAREIAADILRFLIQHATQTLPAAGRGMESCVMTVPVYSSGRYRRELRRAAETAGLRVESFIHEPFAAALGWFYSQNVDLRRLPPQRALVFDWGGGTLDITLVQVQEGCIFELGNASLNDCAGDEFTEGLTALVRDKFLIRNRLNVHQLILEGETKDRVWTNLEDGKIRLSDNGQTMINVPKYSVLNGTIYDLGEDATRDEYEERIRAHVETAKSKVYECLQRAGVEAPLVDLVLLVGGTSRTPLVRRMMNEIFVARVMLVPDADSIIAKGAALISAHKWQPYLVKPVTVKLADKSFLPVFGHGQMLAAPLASKSLTFYCTDGRNGAANLLFYEQQRPGDASVQKTLNCNLTVPTTCDVHHVNDLDRIIANFYVTQDLTIKVEAMSSSTGKNESIEIHDICYGLRIE